MPSFTIAPASGVAVEPWEDPPREPGTAGPDDPGAPSRLNPRAGTSHKRWVAAVGIEVEINASVPGLGAAPLDSSLGGDLFYSWKVGPQPGGVTLAHDAGQSSVLRFTALAAGHYTLGMGRHNGGGAVIFHVDAEPP